MLILIYIYFCDITSLFFVCSLFFFVWTPEADQVKPGLRLLESAPNNKDYLVSVKLCKKEPRLIFWRIMSRFRFGIV